MHDHQSGLRAAGDFTRVKQWVRDSLDLRDDASVLISHANEGHGTVISVLREDVHREWNFQKDPIDLTEADILAVLNQ